MTPAQAIAGLDRQIKQNGQTVTLRRTIGTSSTTVYDVTMKAFVRGVDVAELAGGIDQGDSTVVLSPTAIAAAGWPGAGSIGDGADERVPRRGDTIVIGGRARNIEMANPKYMADVLVRVDLLVRG